MISDDKGFFLKVVKYTFILVIGICVLGSAANIVQEKIAYYQAYQKAKSKLNKFNFWNHENKRLLDKEIEYHNTYGYIPVELEKQQRDATVEENMAYNSWLSASENLDALKKKMNKNK